MKQGALSRHGNLLCIRSESDVSYIGVFFAAGSLAEPHGKEGIAHLVEHVLHREIEKSPSVTGLGDATVERELMVFSRVQQREDTEQAFRLLTERLFESVPHHDVVRREKEVLQLELMEYYPSYAARIGLAGLFGEGSKLIHSAGGDAERIPELTESDVIAFISEHIQPEHALFVVVGKDVEEIALQVMEEKEYLATLPLKREIPDPLHAGKVIQAIVEDGEDLAALSLFIATVPIHDVKTRMKLLLLRACLVGYEHSILTERLRGDLGIVYGFETESQYYSAAGYLSISLRTRHGAAKTLVEEVKEIFAGYEEYLSPERVEKSKDILQLEAEARMTDPEALAWWYGEDIVLGADPLKFPEAYTDTLRSITFEDIRALAAEYLRRPIIVTELN